jgi:phosphoribosylformylglycinamidine synthase
VIGDTKDELGGSEYYEMMNATGLNVPKVDAEETRPLYLALHRAIEEGLVASAHAVSRGGLATHLALVAMGGETGMEITLENAPADKSLPDSRILYSESAGRFVVTIAPVNKEAFEELFDGMNIGNIGIVTESSGFRVRGKDGSRIIEEDIAHLKECWKRPFGGLI